MSPLASPAITMKRLGVIAGSSHARRTARMLHPVFLEERRHGYRHQTKRDAEQNIGRYPAVTDRRRQRRFNPWVRRLFTVGYLHRNGKTLQPFVGHLVLQEEGKPNTQSEPDA